LNKILIVTPHYPPDRVGGTELYAYKLASWLKAQGDAVAVVCIEDIVPQQQESLTSRLDTFEATPVHRLYLTGADSPQAFRNSFDHPHIQSYLETLVADDPPDLIHLMSGYLVTACAIRVAKKYNIPCVVTVNDYWFICPRINLIRSNGQICSGPHNPLDCTRCLLGDLRRYRLPEQALPAVANRVWNVIARSETAKESIPLYRQVSRREVLLIDLLNQANAVVIPTNSLRQKLVQAGVNDNFHLVRHGIDLAAAGIQTGNTKTASPYFRFGYLGEVSFIKGVDLLARAYQSVATDHKNVTLSIWGGADRSGYAAGLQKQLAHTPHVNFNGRYNPAEIGQILAQIDLLVVPSRAREIGPFVILEALGAGTPVIAAKTGNMPELITHNVNGLLFEPGSAGDLETQMRRVLDEDDLCNQLQNGIDQPRTHTEEMLDLRQIYGQLLKEKV